MEYEEAQARLAAAVGNIVMRWADLEEVIARGTRRLVGDLERVRRRSAWRNGFFEDFAEPLRVPHGERRSDWAACLRLCSGLLVEIKGAEKLTERIKDFQGSLGRLSDRRNIYSHGVISLVDFINSTDPIVSISHTELDDRHAKKIDKFLKSRRGNPISRVEIDLSDIRKLMDKGSSERLPISAIQDETREIQELTLALREFFIDVSRLTTRLLDPEQFERRG